MEGLQGSSNLSVETGFRVNLHLFAKMFSKPAEMVFHDGIL